MAIPIVMPQPYDMTETNDNQLQFWIEEIGNTEPGVLDVSPKFAHAVIYGWVANSEEEFYHFKNQMLGWSYVDDYKALRRTLPSQHPRERNLYATKITDARGVQFAGRKPGHIPSMQEASSYNRTRLAIEYAPPRYRILGDEDVKVGGVQKEYLRYLEYDPEVNIYNVTISSLSAFKYAEGQAGLPGPPAAKQFAGELNYYEIKTTFNTCWRQVPEEYIFDTVNYQLPHPKKLPLAAGHINLLPFMGYPKGTLLLLEPKIERYVSGTLFRPDYFPVFYCDVYLPIIHFDPPLYADLPNVGLPFDPIERGHNNKPWYKPAVPTLQYYFVSADGTATGIPIYGRYDFNKIFEHWSL